MGLQVSLSDIRRKYWIALSRVAPRNSKSKEMLICLGSINRDHVHLLVRIPQQLFVLRGIPMARGAGSPARSTCFCM